MTRIDAAEAIAIITLSRIIEDQIGRPLVKWVLEVRRRRVLGFVQRTTDVATQWAKDHPNYQRTPDNGVTMAMYIRDHKLDYTDPASYDRAYAALFASSHAR